MNVLITGISGFAGSHLAQYLLNLSDPSLHPPTYSSKGGKSDLQADSAGKEPENSQETQTGIGGGVKIFGTYRDRDQVGLHLGELASRIRLLPCDVSRSQDLKQVLAESLPDVIFHLAGVSHVPEAEKNRAGTYQINALSTDDLLAEILDLGLKSRVILPSSSEVYGKVGPQDLPITEDRPTVPSTVYGLSKAMMELVAQYYLRQYGMDIVILRLFNHIGPRQSDRFVVSNFSRQIARIALGLEEPVLEVGDLTPQRDFTDVADVVEGYWLAALKGKTGGIYNLCSGRAHTVQEITELLIELSGHPIQIRPDKRRFRENVRPMVLGSFKKFNEDTGWKPVRDFRGTLRGILQYWMDFESRAKTVGSQESGVGSNKD